MILYVDETENEQYFIVVGLLVSTRLAVDYSFKHFKKITKKMNIKQKYKERIFVEFKSGLIDRKYKRIKFKMLEEIQNLDSTIFYSCYLKKEPIMKQGFKEKVYIKLLEKIVSSVSNDIDVVFDEFRKENFELRIIKRIQSYNHVNKVIPNNSRLEAGLMYVDNLCSVIRLHILDEDIYCFFDWIKDISFEV